MPPPTAGGTLIFAYETAHRRHQCTIASLYLSVRRRTVRGRSRLMYVKQVTHCPEQSGLEIPLLVSEHLEWTLHPGKELIHSGP